MQQKERHCQLGFEKGWRKWRERNRKKLKRNRYCNMLFTNAGGSQNA